MLLLVAKGVVDEFRSGPMVGAKCRQLMHRRSDDLLQVVEDSRGKGGARRNLIGDDGDKVVLPRFRGPRMGKSPTSCLWYILIDLPWCVLGDFNEAMWSFEHFSTSQRSEGQMLAF